MTRTRTWLSRLAFSCALSCSLFASPQFQSAQPVWLTGLEAERNATAGFRAVIDKPAQGATVLRLTASNLYRAWINGEFLGHGPARGPHGFFRVDELDITSRLRAGRNVIAIEVVSYNSPSYYLLNQPPFLEAEIVAGGKVLAATSATGGGFAARRLRERLQKTESFSFQRTFSEAYRLKPGWADWRTTPKAVFAGEPLTAMSGGSLLPRRVPYPHFALRRPTRLIAEGSVRMAEPPAKLWRVRSNPGAFPREELELDTTRLVFSLQQTPAAPSPRALTGKPALPLPALAYRTFDLGTNLTGFLGLEVEAQAPARLLLTFDEILTEGDVRFNRLGVVGAVVLDIAPGRYRFETIEPYTARYVKLTSLQGAVQLSDLTLREYVNPNVTRASFAASDQRLNRLFAAGRETYRQNAVDIFMDCPHRERAGWLCDSFFTARVAPELGGETLVEQNFLENFLKPRTYPKLPDDVLPMCYPADHPNGTFIPNWTLWFVLQLEEYLERSGDRAMVDAFRPKVMALFDYFHRFRNSDGLLEKLPSWVFVEWSKANNFVQDVNYPSNMLYAAALASAGRLYAAPELAAEAVRIQETIRRQSFDGEFFVDNALRKEGRLEVTRNRSEVCQYFAFYFGTATPKSHPELWRRLRDEFGPQRAKNHGWPEIWPANSFVGNMLRAELLSENGHAQQLLDESTAYLLYMADRTGTLWENVEPEASCNHGFASHIVHTLYRDILGLRRVDAVHKTVDIRFTSLKLESCRGAIPVPDGLVELEWKQTAVGIEYHAQAPAGYRVNIENRSGRTLTAR